MSQSPTLCLCMTVCNESHVIGRALQSVRDIIDYWLICDNGSTDSTVVEILQSLGGIPGQLHRTRWVNFGHNRKRAIDLAKDKADYILIMDADMIANVHGPFKEKLSADCYEIRYEGPVDYSQTMLIASRHDWAYAGVTHEYIHSSTAQSRASLPELTLTHFADGGNREDKYERDIRLLTESLAETPENPRDTFYLAQSYFDLGRWGEALEWYRKRASMAGWAEEQWYALYRVARCLHELGEPWDKVLEAYVAAHNLRPSRLEALYEIVKHCRETEQHRTGYEFGLVGKMLPYPADTLFIDRAIYQYLFPLEFGVCAHGSGRISEAVWAFNRVLREGPLPQWVGESVLRGQRMALQDLYHPGAEIRERSNRIVIVTPFYNAGSFLKKCVASVLEQDCGNFQAIFLDDASTDNAAACLHELNDTRIHLLRNEERRGLAANLHRLLTECVEPDDIVVCLDGDDWLACPDAVSRIDRYYNEHDCWVMYGQFQYAGGAHGFSQPFASPAEIADQRSYFRTSHIRTFRAGLFQAIAKKDPEYRCLKDQEGKWLEYSADCALMFPLVEMAGFSRVRFNPDILYIYNDGNPLCQHHVNRARQIEAYDLVSRKPRFERIDDYHG
jgi:glycosyltransferase involved in cell wall biosynthesis